MDHSHRVKDAKDEEEDEGDAGWEDFNFESIKWGYFKLPQSIFLRTFLGYCSACVNLYLRNTMIKVEAVLVRAVMPDSIFVSIVGIGRGVGVVGGGTCIYHDDDDIC